MKEDMPAKSNVIIRNIDEDIHEINTFFLDRYDLSEEELKERKEQLSLLFNDNEYFKKLLISAPLYTIVRLMDIFPGHKNNIFNIVLLIPAVFKKLIDHETDLFDNIHMFPDQKENIIKQFTACMYADDNYCQTFIERSGALFGKKCIDYMSMPGDINKIFLYKFLTTPKIFIKFINNVWDKEAAIELFSNYVVVIELNFLLNLSLTEKNPDKIFDVHEKVKTAVNNGTLNYASWELCFTFLCKTLTDVKANKSEYSLEFQSALQDLIVVEFESLLTSSLDEKNPKDILDFLEKIKRFVASGAITRASLELCSSVLYKILEFETIESTFHKALLDLQEYLSNAKVPSLAYSCISSFWKPEINSILPENVRNFIAISNPPESNENASEMMADIIAKL